MSKLADPPTRETAAGGEEPSRLPVPRIVASIFGVFRRTFGKPEDRRHVQVKPDGVHHVGDWEMHARVEPDEDGGFVAECIDLPGCMSQGETVEEALENLADAAGGVLALRLQKQLARSEIREVPSTGDVPSARAFVIPVT